MRASRTCGRRSRPASARGPRSAKALGKTSAAALRRSFSPAPPRSGRRWFDRRPRAPGPWPAQSTLTQLQRKQLPSWSKKAAVELAVVLDHAGQQTPRSFRRSLAERVRAGNPGRPGRVRRAAFKAPSQPAISRTRLRRRSRSSGPREEQTLLGGLANECRSGQPVQARLHRNRPERRQQLLTRAE